MISTGIYDILIKLYIDNTLRRNVWLSDTTAQRE